MQLKTILSYLWLSIIIMHIFPAVAVRMFQMIVYLFCPQFFRTIYRKNLYANVILVIWWIFPRKIISSGEFFFWQSGVPGCILRTVSMNNFLPTLAGFSLPCNYRKFGFRQILHLPGTASCKAGNMHASVSLTITCNPFPHTFIILLFNRICFLCVSVRVHISWDCSRIISVGNIY